jgi:hypothetical protein
MHVPYSTVLNFSVQYAIYDWLDKFTENSEWVRPPAFLAEIAGNLVDLIGRIASIVEVFFHGLGIILVSPLKQNKSENLQRGWSILKTTPHYAFMILAIPVGLIEDLIYFVSEPRMLAYNRFEGLSVLKKHAIAGTLETENCNHELNQALIKTKVRLMQWQDRQRKT